MTQELHYPSFRRWVGRQTGPYQTLDNSQCPMALWAKERFNVTDNVTAGFCSVYVGDKLHWITDREYGMILIGQVAPTDPDKVKTYEALTKRLDANFTKTGLRRRIKPRAPYVPSGPLGSFKRGVSA